MKLEFCLKCRNEHLAVKIMPPSATFHSLEKIHTDIFSFTCIFLPMASEIGAIMQKQYLPSTFRAQKPL